MAAGAIAAANFDRRAREEAAIALADVSIAFRLADGGAYRAVWQGGVLGD